ncbi:MAG: hypothetical protein QM802_02265 [Agriterribacter sp.]
MSFQHAYITVAFNADFSNRLWFKGFPRPASFSIKGSGLMNNCIVIQRTIAAMKKEIVQDVNKL